MANWYGMTRSNYVKVKDPEAFKVYLSLFETTLIEQGGRLGFISNDEYRDLPARFVDDDDEETVTLLTALRELGIDIDPSEHVGQIHITDHIAQFLADNEVLVVTCAGSEKARYNTGWAQAIHSSGEDETISINDIYQMAQERWGVEPNETMY